MHLLALAILFGFDDDVHSSLCEPWCNRFEVEKRSPVCVACECAPDTGDPHDTGMPCSLLSPRPPNPPPAPPVAPTVIPAVRPGRVPRFGKKPSHGADPAQAVGPVAGVAYDSPFAGWATEGSHIAPDVVEGAVRINGDTRVYLVDDHRRRVWNEMKYVRLDLQKAPLTFTLDLSGVPCGCLACVYLVAMADPDESGSSNYCDMAENKNPGYGGGTCYELDLLEANNNAMQYALTAAVSNSRNCALDGGFLSCVHPRSSYPRAAQIGGAYGD